MIAIPKAVSIDLLNVLSLQNTSIDIYTLNNSELGQHCVREMQRYRRGETHDDTYCLELFRRVSKERDQQAWEVLQTHFTPLLYSWMRRHPKHEAACRLDSEENYVAQAFVRFWQATVHNHAIEFSNLAAALRYLQASLNGAIMDTLRAYVRPRELPLPEPGHPEEPTIEDDHNLNAVWESIRGMLENKMERRLAYLLFYCGLKPRDIVKHCPYEFASVRDIYRLRRNILEKLQRNKKAIRQQLEQQ